MRSVHKSLGFASDKIEVPPTFCFQEQVNPIQALQKNGNCCTYCCTCTKARVQPFKHACARSACLAAKGLKQHRCLALIRVFEPWRTKLCSNFWQVSCTLSAKPSSTHRAARTEGPGLFTRTAARGKRGWRADPGCLRRRKASSCRVHSELEVDSMALWKTIKILYKQGGELHFHVSFMESLCCFIPINGWPFHPFH